MTSKLYSKHFRDDVSSIAAVHYKLNRHSLIKIFYTTIDKEMIYDAVGRDSGATVVTNDLIYPYQVDVYNIGVEAHKKLICYLTLCYGGVEVKNQILEWNRNGLR